MRAQSLKMAGLLRQVPALWPLEGSSRRCRDELRQARVSLVREAWMLATFWLGPRGYPTLALRDLSSRSRRTAGDLPVVGTTALFRLNLVRASSIMRPCKRPSPQA